MTAILSQLQELEQYMFTKTRFDRNDFGYIPLARTKRVIPTHNVDKRRKLVAIDTKPKISVQPVVSAPTLSNAPTIHAPTIHAPTVSNDAPPSAPAVSNDAPTVSNAPRQFAPKHFCPHELDNLYWCLYVLHHGEMAFNMIGRHKFTAEKEDKYAAVEGLRHVKDQLKMFHINLDDAAQELTHRSQLTLVSAVAYLVRYNLAAVIIDGRRYVCVNCVLTPAMSAAIIQRPYPEAPWQILSLGAPDKANLVAELQANHFLLPSLDRAKPFKAIQHYTLADLQDMCRRLKVTLAPGVKETKTALYKSLQAIKLC